MVSRSLAVVAETLAFSEVELNEYCLKKGLFPEQVNGWKESFLNSQRPTEKPSNAKMKEEAAEARRDKKRIYELEKELHCKEKALAEAAALLVLQKSWMCSGARKATRTINVDSRMQTINRMD